MPLDEIDEMDLNKYISLDDDQANTLRQDFFTECIKPIEDKKKEKKELEELVLSYDTTKLCEAALNAQNKKEWDYSSFYSKFAVKTAPNLKDIELFLNGCDVKFSLQTGDRQ